MKKFWSYIENDKYAVGCTGQTVYLYDKNGVELAKFKDLTYAYSPAFSPLGNIFVVKSNSGRLAVYSLETLSLIKKFRYSKVDGGQDDGFCFSSDGKYFINIELQGDCLHSAISVYDTSDFSRKSQLLLGDMMMASYIELEDGEYYVLGFLRGANGVRSDHYVGKFSDNEIKDIQTISDNEYFFYLMYLSLKANGFTQKSYDWSYLDVDLEALKRADHSLAKLWKYHAQKISPGESIMTGTTVFNKNFKKQRRI